MSTDRLPVTRAGGHPRASSWVRLTRRGPSCRHVRGDAHATTSPTCETGLGPPLGRAHLRKALLSLRPPAEKTQAQKGPFPVPPGKGPGSRAVSSWRLTMTPTDSSHDPPERRTLIQTSALGFLLEEPRCRAARQKIAIVLMLLFEFAIRSQKIHLQLSLPDFKTVLIANLKINTLPPS